jgi:hypothetical protein
MKIKIKAFPFSEIMRILELKTIWDEHAGQLSLPRKRQGLNVETAEWFLSRNKRPKTGPSKYLHGICQEYIDISKRPVKIAVTLG